VLDTSAASATARNYPTPTLYTVESDAQIRRSCLDNSSQHQVISKLASRPSADYALALREQLEAAKILRSRASPAQTYAERILSFIEGPWAPAPNDLPERPASRDANRSALPFRQKTISVSVAHDIKETKRFISLHERRWNLTNWSSIYGYAAPLRALPTELHGLSILHLSDVHLLASHSRPVGELTALADFLEQNERKVDLVVLSGDLITKGPEDLCSAALKALNRISTICPLSYMVHGNHDYHGHVPALISHQLESVGFKDINNRHVRLRIEGVPLNLYGVDDEYFGRPITPRAVAADEVNILIAHNLDSIRSDCATDIDLILSGHTHWGEVRGFDGASLMRMWGYCDNVNHQTKHWDLLNDRTLSFVHPGLARYYIPWKGLRHPPGFVIHTLVPHPSDQSSKKTL